MQLNKEYLTAANLIPGGNTIFHLPEKILQFGTGVLLRGLCDYFIDKANKQGIFNGRIVVVKSTDTPGAESFDMQDGLYTQVIRGIEDGNVVDEMVINASISRVLSAKQQWADILACAENPQMQIIISNTTEVGITYSDDDIHANPPASFPGKLLAFLNKRYEVFKGTADSGMVIIPTELLVNNADKLKEIVIALARHNNLSEAFIEWLECNNHFCNSLVDRIVPGKLPAADKQAVEQKAGYTDDLMIMCEAYRLWAIEAVKEKVLAALSFSSVDAGVVLAHDIIKFRELKLRLLNGAHTFSCGLAVLCGFETVKDAMQDETFYTYVHNLMIKEIAAGLTNDSLSLEEAKAFAGKVLERFRNPYIQHKWINITLQYSSKMLSRNVPNILNYYAKENTPPKLMGLGFAAYLQFMRSQKNDNGQYTGQANGNTYIINDDKAGILHEHCKRKELPAFAFEVLQDERLWDRDLTGLFGLAESVAVHLENIADCINNNSPVLYYVKSVL